MKKTDRNAVVAFPIVVLIGVGVAVAGSHGGPTAGGVRVFSLCVALAFVIQWPAFIPAYLLLTRVSGVPLLEKRADDKWGGQDEYESYKRRTAVLVPRPPAGTMPRER